MASMQSIAKVAHSSLSILYCLYVVETDIHNYKPSIYNIRHLVIESLIDFATSSNTVSCSRGYVNSAP